MGQRHNSFPEERFTAAHAFLYIGRQMKSFQVEWQLTIAVSSDWVILYTLRNPEGWTTDGWTWEEHDPSHLATPTSPSQVLDRIPPSVYSSDCPWNRNSTAIFNLNCQKSGSLFYEFYLPLVMWIVDGSVSQVPLIKFVLLARVSRDEPAPNRMIKTYQNILFYYYEMNYWVVEMCFLLLVVLLLLSFQYWSRWQPIEVVLMCGDHFISDVPYLTAQRAAMAFTCQSRDHFRFFLKKMSVPWRRNGPTVLSWKHHRRFVARLYSLNTHLKEM